MDDAIPYLFLGIRLRGIHRNKFIAVVACEARCRMQDDMTYAGLFGDTSSFVQAQHHVQILDRSTRGAFAQVVEDSYQQYVARWIGQYV